MLHFILLEMDSLHPHCQSIIYFPTGFCLIMKNPTYIKEENCTINICAPITQIQQLSRFCHTCFSFSSLLAELFQSKPSLHFLSLQIWVFSRRAIMPLSYLIQITIILCYHSNTQLILAFFQLSKKCIFTVGPCESGSKQDPYITFGYCI